MALWLLGAFEEAHTADIAFSQASTLEARSVVHDGYGTKWRASKQTRVSFDASLHPVESRAIAWGGFRFEVRRGDRNIRIALSAAWRWTVHDSGYHAISN